MSAREGVRTNAVPVKLSPSFPVILATEPTSHAHVLHVMFALPIPWLYVCSACMLHVLPPGATFPRNICICPDDLIGLER